MWLTKKLMPGRLRTVRLADQLPLRHSRCAEPDVIAEQFQAARQTGDWPDGEPELLPARLAQACVAVLPVSGAAISLFHDDFRVPLGASDEAAGCAERLQFTTGQGPCLEAVRKSEAVLAGHAQILDCWPEYGQELFSHTPYDAVISLPLNIVDTATGALDLFFTDQPMLRQVSLAAATDVLGRISEAFQLSRSTTAAERNLSGVPEPAWLHGPSAQDRMHVWIAMGMVMTRFELGAADALALLRAYAYAAGSTLDALADELITGRKDLDRLQL